MTGHAVVLTSVRRAFPLELLDRPGVDHVSIVAEAGHPHRFPDAAAAPGAPSVAVIEVPDIRDTTDLLRTLRRVSMTRPIDRILSPVEFGVPAAGFLRSSLAISGESFDVGLAFSDKFLMKRRLTEAGIRTARTARVFDAEDVPTAGDEVGWPVVVKPTFGALCMDVVRLDSREDARQWAASEAGVRLRADEMPIAVEQHVAMEREFHVDLVVRHGEVAFAAVSAYFDPLLGRIDDFDGSWILPPDHPDHDEALALATDASLALGLRDGIAHVELYQDTDGFWVGEAACRPAGGGIVEAIRHQYGVDLWEAYWAVSLGLDPELEPRRCAGIVANVNLPIRPGRIVDLSTEEDLRNAGPGIIEARMTMSVGDVISPDLNSSSTPGVVFFQADVEEGIAATLAAIRRSYRMVVQPPTS